MTKRSRILQRMLWLAVAVLCTPAAFAAYVTTGMQQNLEIFMDNGVTYFRGDFATSGNCLYNRLELRDTGDYTGSVENGRRMYALVLAARMAGKAVQLGYNDTDGPNCRIAEVWVQW
jgi:hypothetical protein